MSAPVVNSAGQCKKGFFGFVSSFLLFLSFFFFFFFFFLFSFYFFLFLFIILFFFFFLFLSFYFFFFFVSLVNKLLLIVFVFVLFLFAASMDDVVMHLARIATLTIRSGADTKDSHHIKDDQLEDLIIRQHYFH